MPEQCRQSASESSTPDRSRAPLVGSLTHNEAPFGRIAAAIEGFGPKRFQLTNNGAVVFFPRVHAFVENFSCTPAAFKFAFTSSARPLP
jgi:hypothetical protein